MRRSELVIEVVKLRKDDEYGKSEIKKMKKEMEEMREEMKFREIVSEKKDAEISKLTLQLALQGSELDKRKYTLKAKFLAIFVSLLFGITSVLFNVASSFVTNTPSNPIGNTLFVIAALVYLICTVITIFMLGGND
jgi:hypothetical protein